MSPERRREIEQLVAQAAVRMSPERCFSLLRACQEMLAAAPPARGECAICSAAARHGHSPAVRLAVAKLADELTVAELTATSTPESRVQSGRLEDWRDRSQRPQYWRIVLESLAHGPLPTVLIDEDINGPPTIDAREMSLRRERTRAVMNRLVARGLVKRVAWGVYALPSRTDGMIDRSAADARRMLAEPGHGRPADGFTVQELADRCDVSPVTVRNWIKDMRLAGDRVVVTHYARAGRHGPGFSRYRIEGVGRPQGTAAVRPLTGRVHGRFLPRHPLALPRGAPAPQTQQEAPALAEAVG